MRRVMRICLCAALAASCAQPAPETQATAPYDAPVSYTAKKAFLQGLAADAGAIEVGDAPKSINAVNYQQTVARNDRMLEKEAGAGAVGALQKLKLDGCVWGPYSEKGLAKVTRDRVGEKPAGAYRCRYSVNYQINPPHGKQYDMSGDGQFFLRDGALVYAGRYPNPYY